MNNKSLFEQAVDYKQYDLEELEFTDGNSPVFLFLQEFILSDADKFLGKDILDIGTGTGWLLQKMQKLGAGSLTGIEPSQKHVDFILKNNNSINIFCGTLDDFKISHQYDFVFAILMMVHIADIDMAMKKISTLLKPDGEFHMFVHSYQYASLPRFDYIIKREDIDKDSYLVEIKRPRGIITDIIRKSDLYKKAGEQAGLKCVKNIGLNPTESLIKSEPKYEKFKNISIIDFLSFKKVK